MNDEPLTVKLLKAKAYETYVEHGRQSGHELDNWLQAEHEIKEGPVRKFKTMLHSLPLDAEVLKDPAQLAHDIQSRCRQWFDPSRTGNRLPIAVAILFTELSLVEVHLNGDSFLQSPDRLEQQGKEFQSRGEIIASIEQTIKAHPELETQLRPDLDRLWANYLPITGSF